MKAGLAITGLVLGWVALYIFGHFPDGAPSPWLPYAALGGFIVTAVVVIGALTVAARTDSSDRSSDDAARIADWGNEGGAVDPAGSPPLIANQDREEP